MLLSGSFIQRINGAFGDAGVEWLHSFPSLLEEISEMWGLTLLEPYADMSYNFVAKVVDQERNKYVLKLGVPQRELFTEIEALKLFNGRGSVKLIKADYQKGALLIELLEPGNSVYYLQDDALATEIAGQVMCQIWRVDFDASKFPSVADWASGFQRSGNHTSVYRESFPKQWKSIAEGLFADLISSMDELVLLHGDLHHWNILSAQRQPWLAIDPKGVIGEPAYELGAWLRNPFPDILKEVNAESLILRRANQLAGQLGFDRDRILAWGLAQAILAAWWSYTEGQPDWGSWLDVAALFSKLP